MIYWINGPYGVGKTTIAKILKERLKKAYIFDPELVGNAIWHQISVQSLIQIGDFLQIQMFNKPNFLQI